MCRRAAGVPLGACNGDDGADEVEGEPSRDRDSDRRDGQTDEEAERAAGLRPTIGWPSTGAMAALRALARSPIGPTTCCRPSPMATASPWLRRRRRGSTRPGITYRPVTGVSPHSRRRWLLRSGTGGAAVSMSVDDATVEFGSSVWRVPRCGRFSMGVPRRSFGLRLVWVRVSRVWWRRGWWVWVSWRGVWWRRVSWGWGWWVR